MRQALRTGSRAWRRFWFEPQPTSTLAVVRMAYGATVVGWAMWVSPDLFDFYASGGAVGDQLRQDDIVNLLRWSTSETAVTAVFLLLVVSSACLAIGYRTRLAAVASFVALASFHQLNPFVNNGGDTFVRIVGLYLVFAPAGQALSLDRWRRDHRRFWEFPRRAPWALRLLQVQVCLIYLFTVIYKLLGETWLTGTAVGYSARVPTIQRVELPLWLTDQLVLVNLLTWGTLLIEISVATLVWNRRARPWVLWAGVALHLGIELTMEVGFFSIITFVGYMAFVPPETMSAKVLVVRDALARRKGRRRPEARPSAPPGELEPVP